MGICLAEGPLPDTSADNPDGLLAANTLGGGVRRLAADGTTLEVLLADRKGIGGLARHVDGGLIASDRDVMHVTGGAADRVAAGDGMAEPTALVDRVPGVNPVAASFITDSRARSTGSPHCLPDHGMPGRAGAQPREASVHHAKERCRDRGWDWLPETGDGSLDSAYSL